MFATPGLTEESSDIETSADMIVLPLPGDGELMK
jgi:hypothetical protein